MVGLVPVPRVPKSKLMNVRCNCHVIVHKGKAGACTKSPMAKLCDCFNFYSALFEYYENNSL